MVVFRAPRGGPPFEPEQTRFMTGNGYLLPVQKRSGDDFDPVRERLRKGRRQICFLAAPHLADALFDAQIGGKFPILEDYGDSAGSYESPSRLEKIYVDTAFIQIG